MRCCSCPKPSSSTPLHKEILTAITRIARLFPVETHFDFQWRNQTSLVGGGGNRGQNVNIFLRSFLCNDTLFCDFVQNNLLGKRGLTPPYIFKSNFVTQIKVASIRWRQCHIICLTKFLKHEHQTLALLELEQDSRSATSPQSTTAYTGINMTRILRIIQ